MSVYWSVILEDSHYEEIDFENESEQVDGTHVKQQHLVNMDMYVSITNTFFLSIFKETFKTFSYWYFIYFILVLPEM